MSELVAGLKAEMELVVAREQCADVVGSGSLQVLATPMLVAAMEGMACRAVADALEEGMTSVGTLVHLEHLAPTPVGGRVTVGAELTAVDGRKLCFRVWAVDKDGEVGRGTHERFLVQSERFMARAATRG